MAEAQRKMYWFGVGLFSFPFNLWEEEFVCFVHCFTLFDVNTRFKYFLLFVIKEKWMWKLTFHLLVCPQQNWTRNLKHSLSKITPKSVKHKSAFFNILMSAVDKAAVVQVERIKSVRVFSHLTRKWLSALVKSWGLRWRSRCRRCQSPPEEVYNANIFPLLERICAKSSAKLCLMSNHPEEDIEHFAWFHLAVCFIYLHIRVCLV